jgi:monoamine oxidase
MGDPRNVAHAKKVSQEKHHKGDAAPSHQPGKKAEPVKKKQTVAEGSSAVKPAEAPKPDPTKLERSIALLAKLRELEFHSRANIEKLAELSLTIEEELKQKAFVESIGDVYSAQKAFHSKISALIESYQTECDRLKPAG